LQIPAFPTNFEIRIASHTVAVRPFSELPEPPQEHEITSLALPWRSEIALWRQYESEAIGGRFKFAFKTASITRSFHSGREALCMEREFEADSDPI
jgi:hypothetical protein